MTFRAPSHTRMYTFSPYYLIYTAYMYTLYGYIKNTIGILHSITTKGKR